MRCSLKKCKQTYLDRNAGKQSGNAAGRCQKEMQVSQWRQNHAEKGWALLPELNETTVVCALLPDSRGECPDFLVGWSSDKHWGDTCRYRKLPKLRSTCVPAPVILDMFLRLLMAQCLHLVQGSHEDLMVRMKGFDHWMGLCQHQPLLWVQANKTDRKGL